MTFTPNEHFAELMALLKSGKLDIRQRTTDTVEYKKFITKFPASSVTSLTMKQYCLGDGKNDSFCWWIERGLEPALGRHSPGTSKGHVLYYLPDGSIYKLQKLQQLSDNKALKYTLKIQSAIINADTTKDLSWIDDDEQIYERAGVAPIVTVSGGRKLRLLSCYHPNEILPISSTDHLAHFLSLFGLPESDLPSPKKIVARSQLLKELFQKAKEQLPSLSTFAFMKALYSSEFGHPPPSREEARDEDDVDSDNIVKENGTKVTHNIALNTILFGPPGTGKTHATVDESLKILDPYFYQENAHDRTILKGRFDALVSDGLIRFITFHQSFSYEDFVEGLRADTDDKGALRYEIVDGIFKIICDSAAVKVTQQTDAPIDLTGRRIWKMSLGDSQNGEAYIYDECIEKGYVLHGFGNGIDFTACQDAESVRKLIAGTGEVLGKFDYGITAVNIFKNKVRIDDLIVVTDGNLRFRAIGEVTGEYNFLDRKSQGDTFAQCRPVRWLRVYSPSVPMEQLMNNRFSQMTIYELRPGSIDIDKLTRLLGRSASIGMGTEISCTPFQTGEKFGTDYVVLHASADILELKKPKGKTFGLSMRLLNELATDVRSGKITLEDIREKRVFDKIPNTTIEPFIVNGYNNILPLLVAKIIEKGNLLNVKDASQSSLARVLIIDEINRGNISRIFGELITLIEPSKRAGASEALSITLPYSKKRFSVPSNVHLIGTMNTTDRSLAGLDIALRRRFTFKEMRSRPELLDGISVEGIDVGQLMRTMNDRIEVLLDRDHCLGHAYFMPLKIQDEALKKLGDDKGLTCADLKPIFSQQVLPLLQEYFFEDWERIAWVLNDQNKSDDNHKFILKASSNLNDLFGNKVASSLQNIDQRWHLNQSAFDDINSYRLILGASQ